MKDFPKSDHCQIKIQNFGPIKKGLQENDGFITIKKITILIGNQAAGKSSIAKLISTFSWLEKALYRGELKENDLIIHNRFIKRHCAYQNIDAYFNKNTVIDYCGSAYNFSYRSGKLSISMSAQRANYLVPKIMYVPAERNFLSAVDHPEKLKGLPRSLSTFWNELQRSLLELSGTINLPIGKVKFQFDKLNKIPKLIGDDYTLRLSKASSGFQSFIPLFLVSKNLSESINRKSDLSKETLSGEEQNRIRAEIQKILNNNKLSEDLKSAALEILSSTYRNSCFFNIVEEPEQNLFPSSQKNILFQLLNYANAFKENKLLLTTHSPYIINYLTLAIKAQIVMTRIKESEKRNELELQLQSIIPKDSYVHPEDAVVYELDDNGAIILLPTYKGLPSDENYLNDSLANFNDIFSQLLEIQKES